MARCPHALLDLERAKGGALGQRDGHAPHGRGAMADPDPMALGVDLPADDHTTDPELPAPSRTALARHRPDATRDELLPVGGVV